MLKGEGERKTNPRRWALYSACLFGICGQVDVSDCEKAAGWKLSKVELRVDCLAALSEEKNESQSIYTHSFLFFSFFHNGHDVSEFTTYVVIYIKAVNHWSSAPEPTSQKSAMYRLAAGRSVGRYIGRCVIMMLTSIQTKPNVTSCLSDKPDIRASSVTTQGGLSI
jgi:hypothetical protein